ncbi:MAG: hypothetical protein LH473_02095 [Chitinophagales bacterium]|nr:hypothetical protein [Chitinophagales bacterium]
MKKYLLLCVILFNAVFILHAQTKLFVYFVSHNEDNIGYLNGNGGYLSYESARSALISFADLIQSKNA